MKAYNTITSHFFQKNSPEQVDAEELDKLIAKYPYLAHIYWLKAKKNKNDKSALQKAAVYAFYPGILQYYLSEDFKAEEKVGKTTASLVAKKLPEKPPLQPLYTEDYFAYTRTRLPEKIENDKPPTMEQVKSFTGWLRMMKKPQVAGKPENELVEENGLAEEKSLKKEEVLTEAMAEIWTGHGKPEEAIRIYEKLILLNPEKKSYFAAKISALKEQ